MNDEFLERKISGFGLEKREYLPWGTSGLAMRILSIRKRLY
jgi:hypothetical protein